MVTINVRFIGSFRESIGIESRNYKRKGRIILRDLFEQLIKEFRDNELKNRFHMIFENKAGDFLVLVNGIEINAWGHLDTELKDGDEVVLLPVSHGG